MSRSAGWNRAPGAPSREEIYAECWRAWERACAAAEHADAPAGEQSDRGALTEEPTSNEKEKSQMTNEHQPTEDRAEVDPMRVNPVIQAVADIREIENRQSREGRERNRVRVDALMGTGLYSLDPEVRRRAQEQAARGETPTAGRDAREGDQ